MTAPTLRPLSLGEVLDTGFGLYRGLFVPLLIIAIVCRVIPALLSIFVVSSGGVFQHPLAWSGQLLISFITTAFGVAAVTFVVSGHYLGRDIPARTALAQAGSLVLPLMVLSFFNMIVICIGLLLLIVPGLILAAGLSLGTVALVLERLGPTAAMDRSWKLSKGFRGKIMLTLFVASMLLFVPVMIVAVAAGIASATGVASLLAVQIVTAVLQVFIFPYIYIVTTVLYYDLRVRKEGFDLELLAAAAPAP